MVKEKRLNEYGDGVTWFRGSMLGKGNFGRVYLATLKNPNSKYSYYPSTMAVKSAEVSASGSIQKEREILSNVKGCPDIIRCFGDETTMGENNLMVYNLLLEYGSGGTLADKIKKSNGCGLPEFEVRVYARSLLRGLYHIHRYGYVHCDLKPDNIILVPNLKIGGSFEFRAKIGDFGLAKRVKQSKKRKLEANWRGTPMYLSPEAVIDNVQEAPCDIWALGCIVLEMLTGKRPWDVENEFDAEEILGKIGEKGEMPKIPNGISKDAKAFLKGCLVRKTMFRLTAEMLLCHPFIEGVKDDDEIEEFEEVEDLNEIDSILFVSRKDNELSCGSFSYEWVVESEDEFSSDWSGNDTDEVLLNFDENEVLQKDETCKLRNAEEEEEILSVMRSNVRFDQSNGLQISSQVSPKRKACPVSFIVPAV